MVIGFEQFGTVDMRVGTVVAVEALPNARKPAYTLAVDFGEPIGRKQSSAQITDLYAAEDLLGSQVVAVVNLAPKVVAGFRSEVLVLGVADDDNRVVLLRPERRIADGARVY